MNKTNLTKAFKELRKNGYFAKQNWKCCQSCGWAAMTDEEAEKAVFYHKQDNDTLKSKGECHLAWSGNRKEIVAVLKKNDIKVLNDKKSEQEQRIHIDINEEAV